MFSYARDLKQTKVDKRYFILFRISGQSVKICSTDIYFNLHLFKVIIIISDYNTNRLSL